MGHGIIATPKYNDDGVYYSHDDSCPSNTRPLKYVHSDYVIGESRLRFINANDGRYQVPAGQCGHLFYQGSNPATVMSNQKMHYKGTWDFVSNATANRTALAEGFAQENMSDTSIPGNLAGATSLQAAVNNRIKEAKVGFIDYLFTNGFGWSEFPNPFKGHTTALCI